MSKQPSLEHIPSTNDFSRTAGSAFASDIDTIYVPLGALPIWEDDEDEEYYLIEHEDIGSGNTYIFILERIGIFLEPVGIYDRETGTGSMHSIPWFQGMPHIEVLSPASSSSSSSSSSSAAAVVGARQDDRPSTAHLRQGASGGVDAHAMSDEDIEAIQQALRELQEENERQQAAAEAARRAAEATAVAKRERKERDNPEYFRYKGFSVNLKRVKLDKQGVRDVIDRLPQLRANMITAYKHALKMSFAWRVCVRSESTCQVQTKARAIAAWQDLIKNHRAILQAELNKINYGKDSYGEEIFDGHKAPANRYTGGPYGIITITLDATNHLNNLLRGQKLHKKLVSLGGRKIRKKKTRKKKTRKKKTRKKKTRKKKTRKKKTRKRKTRKSRY